MSAAWPPPRREPLPTSWLATPAMLSIGLGWEIRVGWDIRIGYDGDSALETEMWALTLRGARRKAQRFIRTERDHILAAREAPLYEFGPDYDG